MESDGLEVTVELAGGVDASLVDEAVAVELGRRCPACGERHPRWVLCPNVTVRPGGVVVAVVFGPGETGHDLVASTAAHLAARRSRLRR